MLEDQSANDMLLTLSNNQPEVLIWFRNWIQWDIFVCIHTWNSARLDCVHGIQRSTLFSVSVFPLPKQNDLLYLEVRFSLFRLLDQLPKAKVVLLRYLFGVLCNIEQYSSPNQMTAYNLSVCIAPSILCAPNANSSESEKDFTKKVMKSLIVMPCGAESPFWTWSLWY